MRSRGRQDAGQTTVEWLGMGMAVLAIIVAVGLFAPETHSRINDRFRDVACRSFGGGACRVSVGPFPEHPLSRDGGAVALGAPGSGSEGSASRPGGAVGEQPGDLEPPAPDAPSPPLGDRLVVHTEEALARQLCDLVGASTGASTC